MAVHGRYLVLYRDLPDAGIVRIERVLHSAQLAELDRAADPACPALRPRPRMRFWEKRRKAVSHIREIRLQAVESPRENARLIDEGAAAGGFCADISFPSG